jgi:hypothetical protein
MQHVRWCLIFLSCLPLSGQSISPDLFSGLKWRLIGPFRGGRAVAASGIPGNGRTFYFGGVDGGMWKTTEAGTGETDIRSDLATGDSVYKTTDGGQTWEKTLNRGLANWRSRNSRGNR